MAAAAGMSVDEMARAMRSEGNPEAALGRFPTLAEVAEAAAFMASDRAGAMTATVANLTCGALAA
jgi:enoyl-[acyl-carrier-protein] reductase (NADH)